MFVGKVAQGTHWLRDGSRRCLARVPSSSRASTVPHLGTAEYNEPRMAPNPSIERTCQRPLRALLARRSCRTLKGTTESAIAKLTSVSETWKALLLLTTSRGDKVPPSPARPRTDRHSAHQTLPQLLDSSHLIGDAASEVTRTLGQRTLHRSVKVSSSIGNVKFWQLSSASLPRGRLTQGTPRYRPCDLNTLSHIRPGLPSSFIRYRVHGQPELSLSSLRLRKVMMVNLLKEGHQVSPIFVLTTPFR